MSRTSSTYRCIALAVCVALTWGVVGPVVHHACAAMHDSSAVAHAPTGVHASHDVEDASPDVGGESCETDAERHRAHDASTSNASTSNASTSNAVSANSPPATACCCSHGTACDEKTVPAATRCCTIQATPTDAPDAIRAALSSIPVQLLVVATVARAVACPVHDETITVPTPPVEKGACPPVRLHVWTSTFLN